VLAVGCCLALGAGQASASHVACGDEITADTTLDSNLVDCPNNGVVIGADDITLDLNGHLIDGDGTPAAGCDPETEFCDFGVLNDGHDGVTVRDGSVREFAVGAFVLSARDNRVLGISSSRNFAFGLVVFETARSVVRDCSLSRNPAPEGDGLGVYASHDLRIVDNSFRRNAQPGIHVLGSTENLIKRNLFSRNGIGILMQSDRNQVRRNRFIRDGGILVAPGDRNVIARNRLSRGVGGISIERGQGNLVARNVVVRARRTGILLGLDRPRPAGGTNTVVRRNLVRGSGGDGFRVAEKNNDSLLRRNVAVGAGDDGFDVHSRSTKLTRNEARRNGDLGIEAVRGLMDGGGNKASGNGDPHQCTNVACK
jgi:parallel beta-helix repeat protein